MGDPGAVATLTNDIFVGNTAGLGGAILTSYGSMNVLNCSVSGNRASRGQFIHDARSRPFSRDPVQVTNCIVSDGPDEIWNASGATIVRYTNLCGGQGTVHDPYATITWAEGNIDADPCFADAGYWDPNGTTDDPNDDFFVEGDYHLKSQAGRWNPSSRSWVQDDVTSPCIDAGDPNSLIGYEPFPNGGRINMGVYGGTAEASKSYFGEPICETIIAGDINGDCRVDFIDLALLMRHWLETGELAEE